jgi:hypothetical protein
VESARRDVRFVMDLPEWICDFVLHSVINVDQLSELRVSIRDLGTAVEIDARNVEDFNSFVIQVRFDRADRRAVPRNHPHHVDRLSRACRRRAR